MDSNLEIALIQTHLIWENPIANRKNIEAKLQLIKNDVAIVVLPEMFTTGFTMKPENVAQEEGIKTLEWLKALASTYGFALVGSTIWQEEGNYYNRLFFVTPSGNVHSYDKKHTFTLAGEDKVYIAGTEHLFITYQGFKICPLICYDLRFPVWARNTVDYDVLLYVANWPKPRINAWDTLLKARAIENMAYCIGVNRIGIDGIGYEYPGHSAVYDVLGQQVAFSQKEEVLYANLSKDHIQFNRKKLRFLEDRDPFTLL